MGLSTVGMYGSQASYTIVNFIIMYVLGDALRRYDGKKTIGTHRVVLLMLLTLAVIFAWTYTEYHLIEHDTALEYCDPLVIAEAVLVFMIFSRLKFQSRAVNALVMPFILPPVWSFGRNVQRSCGHRDMRNRPDRRRSRRAIIFRQSMSSIR